MKYEKKYPLFKTKREGIGGEFDLATMEGRREYFQAKAGGEIAKLKKYFGEGKTFIAYFLGKKNSGKGTYTKLLVEIFGKENLGHLSVGDIVREVHEAMADEAKKKNLLD